MNNLEPSISTLQSSISSTPLEPADEHRSKEGPSKDSSFSQEVPLQKRIGAIESLVKTFTSFGGSNSLSFGNFGEAPLRLS